MALVVICCKGAQNEAKRGSGVIVVLYTVLMVLKILDHSVASLGQNPNMWECSAGDCLHLLHESVTLG